MGKLSDKTRSARRPGKHERSRAKRHSRSAAAIFAGGAEGSCKAGRKKFGKVWRYVSGLVEQAHLGGESVTPKSKGSAGRPLYKVGPRPLSPLRPNARLTGVP